MAIRRVAKVTDGHSAGFEDRVRRSYAEHYMAISDDADDTASDVLRRVEIPQEGATHPDDARAICRQVRVERTSKFRFDVYCEYSTFVSDPAQIELEENPLNDPMILEFQTIHETQVLQKTNDVNGNPAALTNSAHEPWDAADLVVPRSRTAWRITFNRPSFNQSEAEDYIDAVNNVPFYGFGLRQAHMYDITAVSQYRNGVGYFAVTCEIHFDRNTFDLELLDQGHREYDVTFTPTPPFLPFRLFSDGEGRLDPIPRLLNGSGRILAPGAQPVFKRYRYKKERNFYLFTP